MNTLAPHSSALILFSVFLPRAESMITGIWLVLMFERSERHTSKPSASGIIRSVMTIWGQILSALAMPSLPFAAVYTL